jgi:hypothetical protein
MKHLRLTTMPAKAESWPADHPGAFQSLLGLLFDPVHTLYVHLRK